MGVVALVVVTVVLCGLALTREPDPQLRGVDDQTVPSGSQPETDSSESASAEPSGDATPVAEPADASLPTVTDRRRADFSISSSLPDGAEIYDNESVSVGMAVEDLLLQHGPPRGPVAASTLEVELPSDVHKIGVRFRLPGDKPGSVVLAAWQSSFVTSRRDGDQIPSTGMRLQVGDGTWELTSGAEVVGDGEFVPLQGTMNFELYSKGSQAWVVDPAGAVSPFEDPRFEELAGPWVTWQLVEQDVSQTPAVIEALWAG